MHRRGKVDIEPGLATHHNEAQQIFLRMRKGSVLESTGRLTGGPAGLWPACRELGGPVGGPPGYGACPLDA
jgi:hypothetical protein